MRPIVFLAHYLSAERAELFLSIMIALDRTLFWNALFSIYLLLNITSSVTVLGYYYITLETIYSGLSKSNFKDHYGDAAK